MIHYTFELLETNVTKFEEKDHVIPANSLTDAMQKFVRKHDMTMPAYWDEPTFDKDIEITFKDLHEGVYRYLIHW